MSIVPHDWIEIDSIVDQEKAIHAFDQLDESIPIAETVKTFIEIRKANLAKTFSRNVEQVRRFAKLSDLGDIDIFIRGRECWVNIHVRQIILMGMPDHRSEKESQLSAQRLCSSQGGKKLFSGHFDPWRGLFGIPFSHDDSGRYV